MIEPRKGYKIAHFTKVWPSGYREDSAFKITESINKTIQRFTSSGEGEKGCRVESSCYVDQMSIAPEIRSISGNNAPVVFNFHTDVVFCGVATFREETSREFLVADVIDETWTDTYGSLVSVDYFPGEEPGCE